MKTHITTAHEEGYSDDSKTLGVLLNYTKDDSFKESFKESFIYIFKNNIYIFFDTMIDMLDYLLYGEKKMKRAYMEEEVFDSYYDASYIEGKFTDLLEWVEK